ncbi:MAG: hypothetical protein LBD69_03780, partial [Puniceicoccales bacterium]|nr:hypothetical protein [Puniceicoccales bacterium]
TAAASYRVVILYGHSKFNLVTVLRILLASGHAHSMLLESYPLAFQRTYPPPIAFNPHFTVLRNIASMSVNILA